MSLPPQRSPTAADEPILDAMTGPTADRLRRQLSYLADRSPLYRRKLCGVAEWLRRVDDLRGVEYTTKDELRAGQERDPPFGEHLCAPRDALVRIHVTSGTTGRPVAIGLTRADHERNSAIGGAAFPIAGARPGAAGAPRPYYPPSPRGHPGPNAPGPSGGATGPRAGGRA